MITSTHYNFSYDPVRQGFDTSQWRAIFGAPVPLVGNNIKLTGSGIIHYGDCYRGQFQFKINVPTVPTAGDNRKIGLANLGTGAYIYFSTDGATFKAETGNADGDTASTPITWDSSWTAANAIYTVRWEGGTAKFFVNEVQVAVITDKSVTGDTLSLYVANGNNDSMTIAAITCKGIQTYWFNNESSSTVYPEGIFAGDAGNTTELITSSGQLGNIKPNETPVVAEVLSPVITVVYFSIYDADTSTDTVTGIARV